MRYFAALIFSVFSSVGFAAEMKTDTFAFAEPTASEKTKELSLYSTFYHVWPGKETAEGFPLPLSNGNPSAVRVSARDWCFGAMEGTIVVQRSDGSRGTYNYADKKGAPLVNCRPYFTKVKQSVINGMARSRFSAVGAKAPFGLGIGGYRLVPFRTIAVDYTVIPSGTLLYVPRLRGLAFRDPDGVDRQHDGYLYAADIGGLIKGNHIDFFSGIQTTNPFPGLIKSSPAGSFQAFVVSSPAAREFLATQHDAK